MFVKILIATIRSSKYLYIKSINVQMTMKNWIKIWDLRKQRLFRSDATLDETPCGTVCDAITA